MVAADLLEQPPASPPPTRRRWWWIALRLAGGVLMSLLLILLLAIWGLDTEAGHRFVADRIATLPIRSGLRIGIGRIDGSLFRRLELHDLRLYDPQGLFLEAPDVRLDWHPLAWLDNRLDVDRLEAGLILLYRSPHLRPPREGGPLLPAFDIRLGRLRLDRLRLGPSLADGHVRTARIDARIDVRRRRALIALEAAIAGGNDHLRMLLDAAPEEDRLTLDAHLRAPVGSVTGRLLGLARPLALDVDGRGDWHAWEGRAALALSGRSTGSIALAARDGRYALSGTLRPAPFLTGKLQRLTAPALHLVGHAGFTERRLTGTLGIDSAALRVIADGTLDLATSSFRRVAIRTLLKQPSALFPNMSGRDIRLDLGLDGPFRTAAFAYRLTSPRFAFDATGFEDVQAEGRGRFGSSPVAVPIRLVARRVTGIGPEAGGILGNLTLSGILHVTGKALTGEGLALTSDKLKAKAALYIDLVNGAFHIELTGGLARYLIPGLGIVDVDTEVRVVPDPSGKGARVEGHGRAWVRRFDNAFLASLMGGLPSLDTGLVRDLDGTLHLQHLRLTAPALVLSGEGLRRRDGTFRFVGSGAHKSYGPLDLTLDGDIAKPKIDLVLAHPADAIGLANVRLALDPDANGFTYEAGGGSSLGPFHAAGRIQLPKDLPATIIVALLEVTGTRAGGALVARPGGLDGRLDAAGGGISGPLLFALVRDRQRIETHLALAGAHLGGAADLAIRNGRLDGSVLLDPAGAELDMTAQGQGLARGALSLARFAGNVSLRAGRGTIKAAVAGARGRNFDLRVRAEVAPDRYVLAGEGAIDGQPVKLTTPALLTHDGAGWRLAETSLTFAGGSAALAGRFGGAVGTQVDAKLEQMPLSILDVARPNLGLGGSASGSFAYRLAPGATRPTGQADLRIRGLSRAGLVLSSRPIDVGLAGVLNGSGLAARAVMASGGQTIGRAQARIAPLGPDGDLTRAPLFAQLRYAGPADTLWRLTGVNIIDLSGPIAIGADMGGTLAAPAIRGSLKADGARLESSVTGTVLTQVKAAGRFDGSRLVLDSFSGAAAKGAGSVTGRGSFDLAGAHGGAIDLALQADHAPLLARDDIAATITGPLTIRSSGAGGTIAGEVKLERSRFRLGRAAAAAIPRLNLREINLGDDVAPEAAPPTSWRMAIHAVAHDQLAVTGLGLDSEWKADLRIGGAVDNPSLAGRADLIRGTYEFSGRRFDLTRGAIRFGGETPPDPVLDIVADANISGLSATIRVNGSGLHPEISFQSVPALPEDELLARLLFGTSIASLSAPEALQLAGAVNALRTGGQSGLDPINTVRRIAGLDRLRILPADVTTGQGTSVAAGKYIGRRTYVELVTDGQGYSATNLEFRLTRWLSLLSTVSTIGRQSANVRVSKDY